MKRDLKEKVKETVLECIRDYLKKINQPYKSIRLEYINFGGTSDTLDSGAYFVEVEANPDKLYFFAKKNTTLPYRRFLLPYNPIKRIFRVPFSKVIIEQLEDHRYPYVMKARAVGVAMPEYLYIDRQKRIVIEERVEGLDIKRAFLKDPQRTLELTYQAGRNLAKLHQHGLKFGDIKPIHIIYDFKNNKINFVDCEKLKEAKGINDYLHDFHVLACYLPITIPAKYIVPFWERFISGYRSVKEEVVERILSLVSDPEPQSWISISFLKLFYRLNRLTWRMSHGHLRLF